MISKLKSPTDHWAVKRLVPFLSQPEKTHSPMLWALLAGFRWALPPRSWAICWRYTATRLMVLGVVSPSARRLFRVLEKRIPSENIWSSTPYKWVEPFVLTIARFARPDHLEWVWACGLDFRRRSSSGSSFLYELVSSENISGLRWAVDKKMEINDTGPDHIPLLSYIMMHKTPGHPSMEIMIHAGASWDFTSPIGLSPAHTLKEYPQWESWCEDWKRERDDLQWRSETQVALLRLSDQSDSIPTKRKM